EEDDGQAPDAQEDREEEGGKEGVNVAKARQSEGQRKRRQARDASRRLGAARHAKVTAADLIRIVCPPGRNAECDPAAVLRAVHQQIKEQKGEVETGYAPAIKHLHTGKAREASSNAARVRGLNAAYAPHLERQKTALDALREAFEASGSRS